VLHIFFYILLFLHTYVIIINTLSNHHHYYLTIFKFLITAYFCLLVLVYMSFFSDLQQYNLFQKIESVCFETSGHRKSVTSLTPVQISTNQR